jgi:serine/threonine protein kinase
MLIADFGLSKEESLITSNSLVNGMPAYIDPQSYMRDRYKRNKKSDIFSLGMILWEISSEKEPFARYNYGQVVLRISNGIRETRVDGTPESYFKLYSKCWNDDPEKRPNIEEVVEILYDLKNQLNSNYILNFPNKDIRTNIYWHNLFLFFILFILFYFFLSPDLWETKDCIIEFNNFDIV